MNSPCVFALPSPFFMYAILTSFRKTIFEIILLIFNKITRLTYFLVTRNRLPFGEIMKIKELMLDFCEKRLNNEYAGYANNLCDKLVRKRKLDITRGKNEIWAASIIFVIARLNFLFDRDQEYCITPDMICDFFGVKKSTVANRAAQIEIACKIRLGEKSFCRQEITDMFSFVKIPGGMIIPKKILSKLDTLEEFIKRKETVKLFKSLIVHRRRTIEEVIERKARQAEKVQKIAEEKKNQLSLFEDKNQ
jgi:hypothetical protein